LLRFCGGWKGWTSEQALNEDLCYIAAAKIGHIEMLQTVFGKPKNPGEGPHLNTTEMPDDLPPITPDIFDKLFTGPTN